MSPSVIENFVVGIFTSIITALAVWVWRKVRDTQILDRKAAFFGTSPNDPCLVVMNHHPRHKDTMSHGDVETLVEVVRLIEDISGTLSIAPFDKVLEPAGEKTEFCIGSPESNQRTKVHVDNFLKGVRFHPYSPEDPDRLAIITREETFRYESHESEYAVLARFYPSADAHPVILIAGQTSRTNQGAIYFLVRNYDVSLRKQFGNKKSFCLIVKLRSPLTYGYKSITLVKDITDIAFTSF